MGVVKTINNKWKKLHRVSGVLPGLVLFIYQMKSTIRSLSSHDRKIFYTYSHKAKQIKLIVSQAFFLGKPMRDVAFFVVTNHNHNELATKTTIS